MKIIVRVTEEQIKALEVAQRDGRLKALGITGMREVPPERWWHRLVTKHVCSLILSFVAWLCGSAAWFAVVRVPFYTFGVTSGLVGFALGRRSRDLMLFAAFGVALNMIGAGKYVVKAWNQPAFVEVKEPDEPNLNSTMIVIAPLYRGGVYPEIDSSTGTAFVKVSPKAAGIPATDYTAGLAIEAAEEMLGMFGGPKTLVPGSEEATRFNELKQIITDMHKLGKLNMAGVLPNGQTPGRGQLNLMYKGKLVYEGDVYIPKASNFFVILDKNPDDSLFVAHFIPDITKPPPAP